MGPFPSSAASYPLIFMELEVESEEQTLACNTNVCVGFTYIPNGLDEEKNDPSGQRRKRGGGGLPPIQKLGGWVG